MITAASASVFPTSNWAERSPESQGLDSGALAAIVEAAPQEHAGLHSLLIIRHGYLVLDAYFYPFRPGVVHDAASATKSVTSILTGIAVGDGLLKTTDKVLSFFPDERPTASDPRRQQMTVEDLLTMRPGLECGFRPGEQELGEMKFAPDWVRYTLALPMRNAPGTEYGYCSPGFHLLSSIVGAKTGEPEADFADERLFKPLGIKDVIWPADPQGRTHGWGNSHFYPRDFAKLGYLYLRGGNWAGKQIVPADWVRASTTPHARANARNQYGYGWWLPDSQSPHEFAANGRGGQKIAVWPEKDIVIVLTGGGYNGSGLEEKIAAAIRSDAAIPENPVSLRRLHSAMAAVMNGPEAQQASSIPPEARSINGAVYEFPRNASRIESLSFSFPDAKHSAVRVKLLGDELTVPIGLDGRYATGPDGPFHLLCGARGHWISGNRLALDLNLIANINHYTMDIRFDGDLLDADVNEASGLVKNGHISGTRVH